MNKVEGKSPVLYSKLIYSEKHNKMITLFYTNKKKIINPLDYMNQCCYVKLVSTTESIFNGCFLVFFFFLVVVLGFTTGPTLATCVLTGFLANLYFVIPQLAHFQ